MDTFRQKQVDEAAVILIASGYVLLFCLVFVLCSAVYLYFVYPKPQASPINMIATSLPARTPTAHISSPDISKAGVIFEDDFNDNKNSWAPRYSDVSELEIKDGSLVLQSQMAGNSALTQCEFCPYLEQPYYFEADLKTAVSTDAGFGIIFNVGRIDSLYYLLDINTESRNYHIYRHTIDGWFMRVAGESDQIKSFPEVNTLGVYANENTIEIYINGNIIDSYTESGISFDEGYFGLFANDAGFKLIVDRVIISKVKN